MSHDSQRPGSRGHVGVLGMVDSGVAVCALREGTTMKPTTKAAGIEAMIDASLPPTSKGRIASIVAEVCAWCGDKVNPVRLRNAVSLREYRISGLCQQCQDDTFGVDR